MDVLTPAVSLYPYRSASGISYSCVRTHDQRALDTTLRHRFPYLVRIARTIGAESPTVLDAVADRRAAIVAEYKMITGEQSCTRSF